MVFRDPLWLFRAMESCLCTGERLGWFSLGDFCKREGRMGLKMVVE